VVERGVVVEREALVPVLVIIRRIKPQLP